MTQIAPAAIVALVLALIAALGVAMGFAVHYRRAATERRNLKTGKTPAIILVEVELERVRKRMNRRIREAHLAHQATQDARVFELGSASGLTAEKKQRIA